MVCLRNICINTLHKGDSDDDDDDDDNNNHHHHPSSFLHLDKYGNFLVTLSFFSKFDLFSSCFQVILAIIEGMMISGTGSFMVPFLQ
jgi:hypothetical protein